MTAFYMNDAAFDLPDVGFVDRTTTFLEHTTESGAEIVLAVERSPLPEGKSLREVAAEHTAEARLRLRGYTVLFEREREVAELPAVEIGARWRKDDGQPFYAREAHIALGATWMIIAGEGPIAERERCDAYVEHVLESLRPRA